MPLIAESLFPGNLPASSQVPGCTDASGYPRTSGKAQLRKTYKAWDSLPRRVPSFIGLS